MKLSQFVFAVLLITAGVPASSTADGGEGPLADAGLDQSVVVGTTVYLDGGGAVDPDGEIVEYRWSIETPRGETITPTDPMAEMTRFVPYKTGRYHVELTVTDDDGNSRTDTLYVDVGGSVDTTPDTPATGTNESATTAPSTENSPPSNVVDGPIQPEVGGSGNQEPFGRILGPESVRSGTSEKYTLEASDTDGEIADWWWLPVSHATGASGVIDARSRAQSYSFDVAPGTDVELSAVIVDDDGSRSTVTKTVQVTNNPPEAMILGESTVTVGSVHEYEVVASDPDGPVTSVASVTASPAVEKVGRGEFLLGEVSLNQGKTRLFRFTEIPKDDATITVRATVVDEHGGSTVVEKEVTVVEEQGSNFNSSLSNIRPEINKLVASQSGVSSGLFGSQEATPGRITFTAVATDNDSDQLTFEWQFGDVGSAKTVESGETMRSEVSFPFGTEEVDYLTDVPITVTITDQNGNSRTETKNLSFRETPDPKQVEDTLDVSKSGEMTVSGSLVLRSSYNPDNPPSHVKIFLGDGTVKDLEGSEQSSAKEYRYRFTHQYESAGEYVVHVQQESIINRETVSVGKRTYIEWEYEQKITLETSTFAAEKPAGDGWERVSLDYVEYERVGSQTVETLISDGDTIPPGDGWERVGTDVEYHTEQRSTRSTESPGDEWNLSERNVDEQVVFDGWETMTVPTKWMANPDWEYVGKIPKTTTKTETKESATEPAGNGWERGSKTGESVRTGYSTKWVTQRYLAEGDWQYVDSERYVTGYTRSKSCIEYVNFFGSSYCVKKTTTVSPTYETRYEYRVPEYTTEYEWERTVEETSYEYEYRVETYRREDVHEYTKEERVATQYAQWEKPEYNETNIYQWKKAETSWEQTSSLSEPTGDVRNLEKHVRECGEEWDEGEPPSCRGN